MGQAPGFFGKVRSHGDFVGRRLPPDVRRRLDDWLQAALVRSRQDLGDAWLPTWLSSPIWRFVVSASLCGEQAWAGVMMPSHDRVGRCFPLLLLAGIDGTPDLRDCLTVHDGWFAKLEELALSTLEECFSLEEFDAQLVALGLQMPDIVAANGPIGCSTISSGGTVGEGAISPISVGIPMLADACMAGRSAWWCNGSPRVAPCLAVFDDMPSPTAFVALLDGRWKDHGWDSG